MGWDAWEEASTCLGKPVGSVTHTVGMWDDQRETEVERQEEVSHLKFFHLSHRIFRHMHETLNIYKKIN